MTTDFVPMTKAEARRWLKRIREDVREAEQALASNDAEAFRVATEDLSGAGGELFAAASGDTYDGVRGLI